MRSAVLLVLAAIPFAYGATLSGVVKDPSGAAVSQAAVTLESAGQSWSASTDAQGRFQFADIPSAEYRLSITHDGFAPLWRTVTVSAQTAPLAITLQLAAVKTTVQVSGGRSALRNSDPNYQTLRSGGMRSVYQVKDLVLSRDAATFTFRSGSFSFLAPVLGQVTAGVFIGDGNFQLKPAFEIAVNHLKQISGAESVDEDFSSLVVYFTDNTFKEITAHAELADESPKAHQEIFHHLQETLRDRDEIPDTYLKRLIDADDIPNMEAEMLAELYNQTGGSFRAFIHGRHHPGLRFLLNPMGAIPQLPAPEEVALLNYDPSSRADGIWYLSHSIAELRSGRANSAEEKRLVAPEHYRIETAIGHNLHLSVDCEMRLHALRDGVRAVKFQLLPDMQVARLTLDGREIPFLQENHKQDGSFYLVLPQPLMKGRPYQLAFEYEGGEMIRDLGGKLFVILPVQPWYPRVGVSRATFDMTFKVPRGMSVVATGDRVRSAVEGNQDVTQWVSKVALPVAGFNYGSFNSRERTDDSNGFRLEAWLGAVARGAFMPDSALGLDRAENAVRVYQQWYGDAPYSHLAVTESNLQGSMPALLFANTVSWTDASSRYGTISGRMGRSAAPMPRFTGPVFDESLPREVSRQWWGSLVDPVSFHEEWLMRGLADFSGSIYDMSAESDTNDFLEHWRIARDQLLSKTYWGIRRSDVAPLWLGAMAEPFLVQRSVMFPRRPFLGPSGALTGMKGGYVIYMLRGLMFDNQTGDKEFIAMMHDFTATFAHQSVSTEAFRWIVDKHMTPQMDLEGNKKMDWFFREWIYGTELPSYRLEYSVTKGDNGKPLLTGKVTQSGVSDRFRMRVPIYVKFSGKPVRIGSLGLTGNHTGEFRAPLPEEPKKVLLNANYDILCAEAEVKDVKDVKDVKQVR
jgi:hypothetical protein